MRKYGKLPYTVSVVHGGPGAPGEVAPVARELSSLVGILEPLQTATTLEEQVSELHTVLQENAMLPATLVGHSWGVAGSIPASSTNINLQEQIIIKGNKKVTTRLRAHYILSIEHLLFRSFFPGNTMIEAWPNRPSFNSTSIPNS